MGKGPGLYTDIGKKARGKTTISLSDQNGDMCILVFNLKEIRIDVWVSLSLSCFFCFGFW